MKLILTENQINYIYEGALARCLQESLNESINFKDLQMKVKKALVAGVAVTTIISAISKLGIPDAEKSALTDMVNNAEMVQDSTFNSKVDACKAYMEYALKNQSFSMESTNLKPETLVKASIENNFDLPFIMAVAHLESCFGATNRAQRTNSVFSVGSYDNGKNAVTYSDPNQSVQGFINLLDNDYLVQGKTIDDLLSPGGFVNYLGKRYASAKNYEAKIKDVRNRIIRMFPELG